MSACIVCGRECVELDFGVAPLTHRAIEACGEGCAHEQRMAELATTQDERELRAWMQRRQRAQNRGVNFTEAPPVSSTDREHAALVLKFGGNK